MQVSWKMGKATAEPDRKALSSKPKCVQLGTHSGAPGGLWAWEEAKEETWMTTQV